MALTPYGLGAILWAVVYAIEFTAEFEVWWNSLDEDEQFSIGRGVNRIRAAGPALGRPHADTVKGSAFANLKELRVQHAGRPYRVFFAFDPRRTAMLLIGGDKTGNNRFYEEMVAKADAIYAEHLREIERETL
jgi:hypothetical protein